MLVTQNEIVKWSESKQSDQEKLFNCIVDSYALIQIIYLKDLFVKITTQSKCGVHKIVTA